MLRGSVARYGVGSIRRSLRPVLGSGGTRRWFASPRQEDVFTELGLEKENDGFYNGSWGGSGPPLASVNPSTGELLGTVNSVTDEEYEETLEAMSLAKPAWARMPAPARGEVLRKIGERLRQQKTALGALVSMEMGKILPEGLGEVQEAIDICDFAVGLSRGLNGQVIPSERAGHVMLERWNPLQGNVGIISAFNFPVAVFFWNAALSLITGNTHVWKPSDTAALVGVACTKIIADVLEKEGIPGATASLVNGSGETIGEKIIQDQRNELISFTGSTKVGRHVNGVVAGRFGRTILELGGNNAMIVMDDGDIDLALQAALFAAVGTAGQRCTSLRRLIVHKDIYYDFIDRLLTAYKTIKVGDPLQEGVLCGPLHSRAAVQAYLDRIQDIEQSQGEILCGGKVIEGQFVEPTIAAIDHSASCVQSECFAPILYVFEVGSLDEAIELNNSVPQGLSSSLFTRNIGSAFQWTGPLGSDCGIVNVNIGTSGAEIGGAFGGEKETGGGRECGSDSWKNYCRRSTCTINHSDELPLAQGIVFGKEQNTTDGNKVEASS